MINNILHVSRKYGSEDGRYMKKKQNTDMSKNVERHGQRYVHCDYLMIFKMCVFVYVSWIINGIDEMRMITIYNV